MLYVWMMTYLRRNVAIVRGLSYHYLDLKFLKIQRSGFNFKPNLTSAIGDLANHKILASYVSHHNAMAYDTKAISGSFLIVNSNTIRPHV